jgi:hypothetical protein
MYTQTAGLSSPKAQSVPQATFTRWRYYQRGKDKPRLTKDQKRAARRVNDLKRIYRDQYPDGLPNNELGVKYCRYMCRTMAFLPDDRRAQWLNRHAPWIDAKDRDSILSLHAHWYSDRSLGTRLEIDNEDRERLQTWTIEAYDITEEQRRVINREKNRQAQERRRRKNGAKPRAESLSRTKPWEADDISRSAWERRRRKANAASSSPPSLTINPHDESAASPSQPQVAATLPAPSEPHISAVAGSGYPPGLPRHRRIASDNVVPFWARNVDPYHDQQPERKAA